MHSSVKACDVLGHFLMVWYLDTVANLPVLLTLQCSKCRRGVSNLQGNKGQNCAISYLEWS